jgi:hypothetical protein
MIFQVINPPCTQEQVKNLNSWQWAGWAHSFTCDSGNRTDAKHLGGSLNKFLT